jgi:hypothetical protein
MQVEEQQQQQVTQQQQQQQQQHVYPPPPLPPLPQEPPLEPPLPPPDDASRALLDAEVAAQGVELATKEGVAIPSVSHAASWPMPVGVSQETAAAATTAALPTQPSPSTVVAPLVDPSRYPQQAAAPQPQGLALQPQPQQTVAYTPQPVAQNLQVSSGLRRPTMCLCRRCTAIRLDDGGKGGASEVCRMLHGCR